MPHIVVSLKALFSRSQTRSAVLQRKETEPVPLYLEEERLFPVQMIFGESWREVSLPRLLHITQTHLYLVDAENNKLLLSIPLEHIVYHVVEKSNSHSMMWRMQYAYRQARPSCIEEFRFQTQEAREIQKTVASSMINVLQAYDGPVSVKKELSFRSAA